MRECEIDLRVGGRIYIVTEATERMGKKTRAPAPMDGTFVRLDEFQRLTCDARSWTEGEEATTAIDHTNDLSLTGDGEQTVVTLHISITELRPKAKRAAFGMKWGYRSQLEALEHYLGG